MVLLIDCLNYFQINSLKQPFGWLELFTPPLLNKNGTKLALILSQNQTDNAGSYRHITLFSRKEDAKLEPLTSGKFVVSEILKWDDDKGIMYVTKAILFS